MALAAFSDVIAQTLWTVVIVIAIAGLVCALGAVAFWAWLVTSYKYKASYRKVYGDVNGQITLGPRKTKRVGPCKNNSEWRAFMQKKHFPPFPQESIMRGNQIDCYLLPDGTFIPATHKIKKDMDKVKAFMTAIVPEGKSWAINEVRELAKTYDPRAQADKWKTVGLFVIALLIAGGAFLGAVYGGYKAYQLGIEKGSEAADKGRQIVIQYANTSAVPSTDTPAKLNLPFPIPLNGGTAPQ